MSAAKSQPQKITKNEKRSDRTNCRNLLEAQLLITKRFIPHVDCFEKRKKIATTELVIQFEKLPYTEQEKALGKATGNQK